MEARLGADRRLEADAFLAAVDQGGAQCQFPETRIRPVARQGARACCAFRRARAERIAPWRVQGNRV